MKTISLNSAKTLSGAFQDLNYEKLEIAVKLNQQPQKYEGDIDFMNLVPKPQLNNSTLSLNFSYAKSQTQLVVSLFGPTESRISSKQHPDRAFIELTIKDTTSKDSNMLADQNSYEDLRSTLRNLLEQVIQLNAYPKSIISFQVFVVKDETLGVQLFSACFNGLLSVVQQAGITLKNSPVVALTIGIKEKEMGDNFQIEYMSDFSHEQVKAINAESSDIQIIDLMVQNKLDIGFMRTRGSTLPMSLIIASQESKKEFEKIIKAQSKLIRKQFLNYCMNNKYQKFLFESSIFLMRIYIQRLQNLQSNFARVFICIQQKYSQKISVDKDSLFIISNLQKLNNYNNKSSNSFQIISSNIKYLIKKCFTFAFVTSILSFNLE